MIFTYEDYCAILVSGLCWCLCTIQYSYEYTVIFNYRRGPGAARIGCPHGMLRVLDF